jgi:hypothetical protein
MPPKTKGQGLPKGKLSRVLSKGLPSQKRTLISGMSLRNRPCNNIYQIPEDDPETAPSPAQNHADPEVPGPVLLASPANTAAGSKALASILRSPVKCGVSSKKRRCNTHSVPAAALTATPTATQTLKGSRPGTEVEPSATAPGSGAPASIKRNAVKSGVSSTDHRPALDSPPKSALHSSSNSPSWQPHSSADALECHGEEDGPAQHVCSLDVLIVLLLLIQV